MKNIAVLAIAAVVCCACCVDTAEATNRRSGLFQRFVQPQRVQRVEKIVVQPQRHRVHDNRQFIIVDDHSRNNVRVLRQTVRSAHEVPNIRIIEEDFVDRHGIRQVVRRVERIDGVSNRDRGQIKVRVRDVQSFRSNFGLGFGY